MRIQKKLKEKELKEKEVDVPKETLPETKHGKGNLKKLLSVQNLKKNKLIMFVLIAGLLPSILYYGLLILKQKINF